MAFLDTTNFFCFFPYHLYILKEKIRRWVSMIGEELAKR